MSLFSPELNEKIQQTIDAIKPINSLASNALQSVIDQVNAGVKNIDHSEMRKFLHSTFAKWMKGQSRMLEKELLEYISNAQDVIDDGIYYGALCRDGLYIVLT